MAVKNSEVLKYLKAAIDLETDVATQEAVIRDFNDNALARKPQLQLMPEPKKPDMPSIVEYHADWTMRSNDMGGFFLFFGIIFGIAGVIALAYTVVLGVFILLMAACCFIPYYSKKNAASRANEMHQTDYQSSLDQYNRKLNRIKEQNANLTRQYNMNYTLWEQNKSKINEYLSGHLHRTKELLTKLYSYDFIYTKYQNLPALTSIFEYLLTGRCEELVGPHGAYNLYEDEVRKDTVISQLNTVIDHLEQIKQNQYMLYQQAKKISDNTTAIKNEISTIRGYTCVLTELSALNTYYAALTASNTNISATFHLLNG